MWDFPGPGIEPVSPASAGEFFTTEQPGTPNCKILVDKWRREDMEKVKGLGSQHKEDSCNVRERVEKGEGQQKTTGVKNTEGQTWRMEGWNSR